MKFAQLEDGKPHIGGFVEQNLHLPHLDSNQLLIKDAKVHAVGLGEKFRGLKIITHLSDVGEFA